MHGDEKVGAVRPPAELSMGHVMRIVENEAGDAGCSRRACRPS